jgi:hypothetical protein
VLQKKQVNDLKHHANRQQHRDDREQHDADEDDSAVVNYDGLLGFDGGGHSAGTQAAPAGADFIRDQRPL